MKYRYSSEWIQTLESKKHWELYWYQQKIMQNRISKEESILEIGVGSGFTSNYLKSKGYKVKSVDIDPNKRPDFIENIVDVDQDFFSFDVILAFNIFEHIPYNDLLKVFDQLKKSQISKMFISLPIFKKLIFEAYLYFILFPPKDITIFKKKKKINSSHHHWELEYNDYTLKKLKNDLNFRNFFLIDSQKYYNQHYLYFRK